MILHITSCFIRLFIPDSDAASYLGLATLSVVQTLHYVPEKGYTFREPKTTTKAFHKLAKSLGIPGVRLHDLRHTHATFMLRQGVYPKIASERPGHSSVAITLDTYSHVMPGIQAAAARRFDEGLQRDREDASAREAGWQLSFSKSRNGALLHSKIGGDDRIRTGDKGFADPRLNHLATSPHLERKTRFELATSSLARRHSTAELLPPYFLVPRGRFELPRA